MKSRIARALLLAVALASCSHAVLPPVRDPVVDGWPIGPEQACNADPRCPILLDTARIGLDRRDPGHPLVIRVSLHTEGVTLDANGKQILTKRSGGCCSVARFELADGSVRAIGVGYPGISETPMAIDFGP